MLQDLLNGHYGHAGLVILFVAVFFEDFGLPLPGETVLVATAALAAKGALPIGGVVSVAFIAAVLGDNVGYLIGRSGGHRLLLRKGAAIGLTHARLHRVERFFDRYGAVIVVVARFFEGLRQLNGIVAGSVLMDWRLFLVFNALGAALWVGFWGIGVYLFGDSMLHYASALYERVDATTIVIGVAVFILVLVLGIWAWRLRNGNS